MLTGLAATGGVITAGLVLAGTFAALATLPLVILTEIGFTVALGVLLDTLVVRSVLVTALTLDIGRHMWWPSRLAAGATTMRRPSRPGSYPRPGDQPGGAGRPRPSAGLPAGGTGPAGTYS
jgi:RND superfamily putative drug exporter